MPLFNLGFLKPRKSVEKTLHSPHDGTDSDSEDEIVVPPPPRTPTVGRSGPSLSASLITEASIHKLGRRRGLDMSDIPSDTRSDTNNRGGMLYSSDNGMLGMPAAGRPGNILSPTRYIDVALWRSTSEFELLRAVQLATDRSVLAKVYDRSSLIPSKEVQIICQQYILSRLSGVAGVLRYYGLESDARHICFLFKQDLRSSLKTYIAINGGQLSEGLVAERVIAPLLVLLSEIHRLGIIHRDICPDNIIFNDSEPLALIGFDHSVDTHPVSSAREDVEMGRPNLRVGTLCYMAPEVANSKTPQEAFHEVVFKGMSEDELPQYGSNVDIFSMGVLMHTALTGSPPWPVSTALELQESHRTANIQELVENVKHISNDARDFMVKCMTLDPMQRPGANLLLDHPWLQKHVETARKSYEKVALAQRKSLGRVDASAVARRSLCSVHPDTAYGKAGELTVNSGVKLTAEMPSRLTKYSDAPCIPEALQSEFS
eukprot:CAMPEP_0117691470 /NCGR_PEP_ID=MMETSP0804-20121206/25739_1 /TAXON_ID=1074897 /ORGANISM="Tetraselmis astigmatica, Strain CCMP880" /LENGTH=486 /DNA_ID=CAMNT_0005504709 /DNA_START=460 /DNA_END=1920 /DNA_ORIENTATION=-